MTMGNNKEIKILELLCSDDEANNKLGYTIADSLNINIRELCDKYGFYDFSNRQFYKDTNISTITGCKYWTVSIDGKDWDNWEEVIDTLKYNKICTLVIYNCKFSRLDILSELNVHDFEIEDCNLKQFPKLPKNVVNLSLADNEIEEIPNIVYPNIGTLRLSNNRLTKIPDNINELYPELDALNISNNLLTDLPPITFSEWIYAVDNKFPYDENGMWKPNWLDCSMDEINYHHAEIQFQKTKQ